MIYFHAKPRDCGIATINLVSILSVVSDYEFSFGGSGSEVNSSFLAGLIFKWVFYTY